MSRIIVNVATDSWIRMQARLVREMNRFGEHCLTWRQKLPDGCPPHREAGICAATAVDEIRPYAFKAYALLAAAAKGHNQLMWCDSSIVPIRSLAPLWERIERDGYWMCRNGWRNDEWTADDAYADLFPDFKDCFKGESTSLAALRDLNSTIPHVVATTFGISLDHPKGRAFLSEYYRLASQTRAFCGPWQNTNHPDAEGINHGRPRGPCGPPHVLGHRHDQTAASVIAWRLGFVLDAPPTTFAYSNPCDTTILMAKELEI